MLNKSPLLAIVLVIIVIFFLAFLLSWEGEQEHGVHTNEDSVSFSDTVPVTRDFKDGVYTITGVVQLPTPCHSLSYDILVAESFPEQVSINFKSENESEFCVQVITPTRFNIEVTVSEGATFSATFNGEPVRLDISDVRAEENVSSANDSNIKISDEGISVKFWGFMTTGE